MSLVDFDLQGSSKSGGESTDSLSSKAETQLEAESPSSKKASSDQQTFDQTHLQPLPGQQQLEMASDNIRTGLSQNQSVAKQPLEKVLSFGTLLILVLLFFTAHLPRTQDKRWHLLLLLYDNNYLSLLPLLISHLLSALLFTHKNRSQQPSENQQKSGVFLIPGWFSDMKGEKSQKGECRIFTVVTNLVTFFL